MIARKNVFFATNLLGLNFSCIAAPVLWIAIFQSFTIAFGCYLILYVRTYFFVTKLKRVSIYTLIDIFQIELFFFLQIFFTIRAFKKRLVLKDILNDIHKNKQAKCSKSGKVFFLNISIIILVRILKIASTDSFSSRIYMTKIMFSELVFAGSDFLFQFCIIEMTESLKEIKVKVLAAKSKQEFRELKRNILENFLTKRNLAKYFCVELFLTIMYNYIQLIISLYWTFMRLKFKRLGRLTGKKL